MKSGDERRTESFVNLRPFAFAAVAFAAGVCFCFGVFYCDTPFFTAFLTLPVAAAPLLFSPRKRLAALCFFTFLLFLGLGMGGFALQTSRFETQPLAVGEYDVSGRVDSFTQGEEYSLLVLENFSADGAKTEGKIAVYFHSDGVTYTRGDRVRLTADVEAVGRAYRYHTFLADYVTRDIRYTAFAGQSPVIVKSSSDPFGVAAGAIRETLYDNLSEENAALAYALTTGNTDGVEEGLFSSVRYGGVAHLFAVSGLHVGSVFLALRLLCKKGKLPVWARAAIPVVGSFLFCGVCGFSISSLRAFVVLAAGEGTKLFGSRADGIELTAFAFLCLTLFSPAQIFSVGLPLSLTAYIGAAILSPVFTRRINGFFVDCNGACPRRKGISAIVSARMNAVLRNLANAFAVTACAQACVLPVLLFFFGYASVWGLLLNLFLLPLFAAFFPVLLACVLLACPLPFAAGALLFLPALALSLFASFFYLCDFSGAILCGFTLSAVGAAGIYLLLIALSGRLNFKKIGISRILPCGVLTAVILFDCAAFGTAALDDCRVTHMCYYENFCCSMVEWGDEHVLLLGGKPPESRLRTFLYKTAVTPTAVVLVTDDPVQALNGLMNFSFGDVYIYEEFESGLRTHTLHVGREFTIGELSFSFTAEDRLVFTFDGVTGVFDGGKGDAANGAGADFTLFSAEARDGLIFKINRGILYVT